MGKVAERVRAPQRPKSAPSRVILCVKQAGNGPQVMKVRHKKTASKSSAAPTTFIYTPEPKGKEKVWVARERESV
jgi:hypothetical protein